MRRLEHRIYAGIPRETVTVDTEVEGGGHVTVLVDGTDAGADATFKLKRELGDETAMSIKLVGATGESCVVKIGIVDGGVDPDLLLCQISDPAPVHLYRFIVTPQTAIAAMERAAPRAVTRAKRRSASKAAKKRTRKAPRRTR